MKLNEIFSQYLGHFSQIYHFGKIPNMVCFPKIGQFKNIYLSQTVRDRVKRSEIWNPKDLI